MGLKIFIDYEKIFIILFVVLLVIFKSYSQGYNNNRILLTYFLIRMYTNAPFEGVRIINDYDNSYLISVLSLDKAKYKTEAILNRVALVKAMAQASRYFNGSNIVQNIVIRTSEKTKGESEIEIVENIRENSVGYIKELEQLTNFIHKDGKQVFIFIKKVDEKANNR